MIERKNRHSSDGSLADHLFLPTSSPFFYFTFTFVSFYFIIIVVGFFLLQAAAVLGDQSALVDKLASFECELSTENGEWVDGYICAARSYIFTVAFLPPTYSMRPLWSLHQQDMLHYVCQKTSAGGTLHCVQIDDRVSMSLLIHCHLSLFPGLCLERC